jgi:putative tryptophan/tyrosine transport system substrate-binding protein
LQQATKTIPIVAMADDMLGEGFVNSLARPDGNTTGVSILAIDLDGKRQEILIEAVPGLRRMAALAADEINNTPAKLDVLQQAAHAHGVELSIHRVARAEEIAVAIDTAQTSGATALNILASPLFYAHAHVIMEHITALRIPAMFFFPEERRRKAPLPPTDRASAIFLEIVPGQIIKLFRGIKVADIPVEQPTKFELVINLKTAKAMSVTVPEALLVRADKVIE